METKTCTRCKLIKNVGLFYAHKRRKSGLNERCKQCCADIKEIYYYKNRKEILEKSKIYTEKTKEVRRQYTKVYRQNNKGKLKCGQLRLKYGITNEEYECILKSQNYVCKICKNPEVAIHPISKDKKSLAVDHCHTSGKIRGLLCLRCNTCIGGFEDSIESLKSAIEYLEKYK